MALFTDAEVVTLEDLLQFETSLVHVASTHGINVETKINVALNAIADRVLLWLLQVGASDPQWMTRRTVGLSTVVVTPPVQRWICFDALSRFFAEAYNVQLNTRFQGKWIEYQKQADDAVAMVFASGVGIVYTPLPKPTLPLVAIESGGSPAQSIFVQTAWVDVRGDESGVSPVNGLILPGQSSISVAMAEGAMNAPPTAVGWNVYVSATGERLTKQNSVPLQVGTTWSLPSAGLIQGPAAINGQKPDYLLALTRRILRG
jgi:hypothetical protein